MSTLKSSQQVSPLSDSAVEHIKQKSISGALSYFMRSIFLQGLGFVSAIILSALLEPEDFGVYGFVIQIIGLLTFVSDIGLAAALIQKRENPSLSEYRTAFTVQQILSWVIVLLVLGLVASGFVTSKVGAQGNWILLALAISFPLASLKTVSSVLLERELEFSKLVIPQIVEQILFHLVLILLAWRGLGALSYAYAIFARSLAGTAVMLVVAPWRVGFQIERTALRQLFGFGFKFQLNDFLARVKDQLFFLALGLVMPLREFGYVQWSKNWSMYPYSLTVQNVMAVTFPTFSRLQHDRKLLGRAIEKALYFISLCIFPVLVGMVVFIEPVVALVPSYAKWQPALWTFIWFTLSVFWSALSTPLTNTFNAIGKIHTTLKLMVMWTSLTWILTPLALWAWGFTGVAFSAFIISCSSVVTVLLAQREAPIRFWQHVGKQTIAATIMLVIGIIGNVWWKESFAWLFGGMISLTGLYALVFLLIGWSQFKQEYRSLLLKKIKA